MKIVLRAGEKITVAFEDADGEFEVSYNENDMRVTADLPDDAHREGIIYQETFGPRATTRSFGENKPDGETEFTRIRKKVYEGMTPRDRHLWVMAIAHEEADRLRGGNGYYAWNRVAKAASEANEREIAGKGETNG